MGAGGEGGRGRAAGRLGGARLVVAGGGGGEEGGRAQGRWSSSGRVIGGGSHLRVAYKLCLIGNEWTHT